jgi:5-methylthioadenosine/S-adenosylhomocysteine deaminase
MHVAEGADIVAMNLANRGVRSVEFLDSIGLLTSNTLLVHATAISDREVDLIARSGAAVCHCAISNAKTAAGVLPLPDLLARDVAVCLGTDAASTGNTNNLLLEAYVAGLLQHARTGDATKPDAATLFELLTVRGATAVGRPDLGLIEPGYAADLVIWNMAQTAFKPSFGNPLATLVYCPSEVHAERVYVGGQLVYDRQPTRFSIDVVTEQLDEFVMRGAL